MMSDSIVVPLGTLVGWEEPAHMQLSTQYWVIQRLKELRGQQPSKERRGREGILPLQEVERMEIEQALAIKEKEDLTYEQVAGRLGISHKTLWEKRQRYDLD